MKIGEAFIKAGLITQPILEMALKEQDKTHQRIGDILLTMGVVERNKMTPVLAEYFKIPYIKVLEQYPSIPSEVLSLVPQEIARKHKVLPVERKDRILVIVLADPLNLEAIDILRIKSGLKIQYCLTSDEELNEAIAFHYNNSVHLDKYIDTFISFQEESVKIEQDPAEVKFDAGDQPVVHYVQSLIIQAVNGRASDILIHPKEKTVDLRLRVDGMLYQINPPPKIMLSAISTRIKILAGLDIAERRLPQDGRFKVAIGERHIDIRTSTFPTIYGESVVLRLLDVAQPLLGISQLGFDPEDMKRFVGLIQHSYGLILVTGPTGSGKTTTLYTALNEIKTSQKNIITLEDPVEYRLPFMQQAQVNPQIGFTFSTGLRSILRQDPDIIMVGEIRDKETAEIAIHASLTGHLVFTTIHTNDAAGAIVRLINMGIEPFLISSSLLGVVAQRLIRIVCPHCSKIYKGQEAGLVKLNLHEDIKQFYRGTGCEKCMHSGYKGRKGIYEVLIPSPDVKRMIVENRSSEEIRKAAQASGMSTLRQRSLDKLKEGLTTPEEVLRVTQETEG